MTIEVAAHGSGDDSINKLVSAIDRLEASLSKLGASNDALARLQSQMQGMQASLTTGFTEMRALAESHGEKVARTISESGDKQAAAVVAAGLKIKEADARTWEQIQRGSAANVTKAFNQLDRGIPVEVVRAKLGEIATATAESFRGQIEQLKQFEANTKSLYETHYRSIAGATEAHMAEARAMDERFNQTILNQAHAQAIELKSIQQRRDLSLYEEAVAAAARTQALIEKRDLQEYEARSASAAALKALIEKRDLEEYEIRSRASAALKALIEKRDLQEYETRSASAAAMKSLIEKRDMEEYTTREAGAARIKALAEKQQYDLHVIKQEGLARDRALQEKRDMEEYTMRQAQIALMASAAERQRSLNTNFITASPASQLATAVKAQTYAGLGGDAAAKYGSLAAGADINALRAAHEALQQAARASSGSLHQHNGVMNEGHALARGLAGSLGGLWLTYGSLVPLAAGAALAASMKAVVTAGKDVEYQLQFVQALGGGKVNLDQMLRITSQTVVSVKEAAEGMRALAQNGLSAANSLAVLPSILNLAVIGEMSVSQAALSATGTLSAFGLELSDLDRVANIFAKAAATSNTSVLAMTESMKQASTVAAIYGASVEETAGVLGVLAKVNITGSAAGTAYTNMLTNLYTPTEKAKKALAELKITTDDGNGGLKNTTQLLGELRNALAGYNDSAKATFTSDIFTVRGQKGFATIMTNWSEYIKKTEEARQVTEFMGDAVATLEDSTEGALKRLANNASASFNKAFEGAKPALQSLVTELAHVAGSKSVVNTLTTIADALLRVTKLVMDNSSAIGYMLVAYVSLQALSALPAMFIAISSAVNTLTISMRGLTASLGWVGLAVSAAMLAYTLFIDQTSAIEKADQRRQNSINVNIEYLDREIDRLTKRNALWDPKTLQFNKEEAPPDLNAMEKARQTLAEREARLKDVNAQLSAKKSGDMGLGVLVSQKDKLLKDIETAKRDVYEVTVKQEEMDIQRSVNQTNRGLETTASAIRGFIRQGEAYDKLSTNFAGRENPEFLEKAKEAQKILDQLTGNKITNTEAVDQLSKLKAEASALLDSRAPKPDKKTANDQLKADLESLQLKKDIAKLDEQMALNSLKAQNKRGELGDLQLINAELAQKLKLNHAAADVAKEQYDAVAASAKVPKQAALQKYQNEQVKAGKMDAVDKSAAEESRASLFSRMAQEELKFEAKTLTDKGQLVDAYNMQFEADHKTMLDRVYSDMEVSTDEATTAALAQYLLLMTRMQNAGGSEALGKQLKAGFDVAFSDLDVKMQTLSNASGPGSGLSAIFDNALRSEQTYAAALPDLMARQAALQALADAPGSSDGQKNAALAALKQMESAGAGVRNIWIGVGKDIEKALTSAFGKAGTAMGGLTNAAIQYAVKQKQIDEDLEKNSKGANDTKRAELAKKAASDSASAQIEAYGDMAGAAKGFFNEQAGGYKALEKVEKAFRIASLAMTANDMLAKLTATATVTAAKLLANTTEAGSAAATVPVVVGAEAAKSGAYGVTALAAALAAPFPENLGAFAMVAALLASIGVASRSGGGASMSSTEKRQKEQGTGTVFGDATAKSESIAKSLEMVDKNTFQGLHISSDMLTALRAIQGSIGSFSSLVLRTTGLTGITAPEQKGTGSSMFSAIGNIFAPGLNKISNGWLSQALGKVGNSIFGGNVTAQDTGITMGKATLGQLTAGRANSFSYTDTKTDGGLFSSDKYKTDFQSLGADGNNQFTAVFKGMSDSIQEAAKLLGVDGADFTNKLNNFQVDIGRISLKGLNPEEQQKAIQSVLSNTFDKMSRAVLPSLDAFAKGGEGYAETAMRVAVESQTVDVVMQSLGTTFGKVGFSSLAAREQLIELSGGLSNFTSQAESFLKDFFTSAEQADALKKRIQPTLSTYGLSASGPDAAKKFRDYVVALDKTTPAGAAAYAALMGVESALKQVIDAAKEVADEGKALQDQIDELSMTKIQLLNKERDALNPANRALFDQLQLQKKLADTKSDLADAYDQETSKVTSTIDRLKSFGAGLRTFRDGLLLGGDSPLTPAQKYAAAQKQYNDTLAKAKGGDVKAQDSFQSVSSALLSASRVANASGSEYTDDFTRVTAASTELAEMTDNQVTVAEASLAALKTQVGALIDIKEAVLSIPVALANYEQAKRDVDAGAAAQGSTDKLIGVLIKEVAGLREEAMQRTGAQIANANANSDKIVDSNFESADAAARDIQFAAANKVVYS